MALPFKNDLTLNTVAPPAGEGVYALEPKLLQANTNAGSYFFRRALPR